jgi:rod shape-determining protein MreD
MGIPVMIGLVVLQTAVLPFFPVLGVTPQLPFLFALAWALLRDPNEGLIWAFFGGFFMDMFSLTPMGLTSLVFVLAITAVLWIERAMPTSRVFLPLLLAAMATLVYIILYAILLRLFGQINSMTAVAALPVLVPLHAVVMLPVYWLLYVINNIVNPRRVAM